MSFASFVGGLALSLGLAAHFDFISLPSQKNPSFAALADLDFGQLTNELHLWLGLQLGRPQKQDTPEVTAIADADLFDLEDVFDTDVADFTPEPSPLLDAAGGEPAVLVPDFDREKILADGENRISEEFHVPAGLKDRVGFWFDVYSKYDSNQRIIHHSRYPWIIYKVIDVSPIINAQIPRHRWLRNEKADNYVRSEEDKIRKALRSVARRSNMNNLNEYETLVVGALSKLKGPVKKQASLAAADLRVQVGQRNFFQEGLQVSPRYLSGMEDIFRSYNLPVELTRIPFVESSFNKQATSKVGASGVWQFMNGTGRKFMIVNDRIDERRSPFKASEGAARLLKENHLILHRSWPLAITAWNHGPPGVRKAIHSAGAKDLALIIERYRSKSFDFASSNFYSEFLGALFTEKYNAEIFGKLNREKILEGHSSRLAYAVYGKELLRKSGLSKDEFELLNPDLQIAVEKNASVPAGFKLMLTKAAQTSLGRLLKAEPHPRGDETVASLSPASRIQ